MNRPEVKRAVIRVVGFMFECSQVVKRDIHGNVVAYRHSKVGTSCLVHVILTPSHTRLYLIGHGYRCRIETKNQASPHHA